MSVLLLLLWRRSRIGSTVTVGWALLMMRRRIHVRIVLIVGGVVGWCWVVLVGHAEDDVGEEVIDEAFERDGKGVVCMVKGMDGAVRRGYWM